jgi:2,3-dihydroxybiphenyl 1,2-dioxygenase
MSVKSRDQSFQFYRDVIGLELSDWVHPQGDTSRTLTFMHCNARHHSLAFLEVDMPKRLHHFLLEVERLDDVGATHDLCQDRDIPIVISLGRHTNDGMLSFYMETPSGFSVECGWGATEIDARSWRVQQHMSGSIWGHRR